MFRDNTTSEKLSSPQERSLSNNVIGYITFIYGDITLSEELSVHPSLLQIYKLRMKKKFITMRKLDKLHFLIESTCQ